MNFLSVINGMDIESFGGMLSYDKEKKELTFTNQEDGKTYKCYVNSMSALVNFSREYVTPYMASSLFGYEDPVNNVITSVIIFMLICGDYADNVIDILKLAIDGGLPDYKNTSYTYWLKASIEAVKVLDTLATVNGTWSSVYSLSGLKAGADYGPKVEASFAGTINWGDGEFTEVAANVTVNHQYTKDGDYTITIKGPALASVRYAGEGGTNAEEITKSYTPFEFKNTPTE